MKARGGERQKRKKEKEKRDHNPYYMGHSIPH